MGGVPTLVGGTYSGGGSTYLGRYPQPLAVGGGTYPGGGLPTLVGGYLPWGGTYSGGGAPT